MSSAGTTKKYKLASSSVGEDGKPRLCAFFLTESGCRMGAKCKFSHERSDNTIPTNGGANKNPAANTAVTFTAIKHELVSSESENENDVPIPIAQKKNSTIQNQQQNQNHQQQYTPSTSVVENEQMKADDPDATTKKKKKKKRKNKSTEEVAVPAVKVEVESSSPFVDHNSRNSNKKMKPTPAVSATAPVAAVAPATTSYSGLAINAPVPNFPKLSDSIREGYNTDKFIIHKNTAVEPAKPTIKPNSIQNNRQPSNILSPSVPANFRALNLPVASFSIPVETPTAKATRTPANTPTTKPADKQPFATNENAQKIDESNKTVKISKLVLPQSKIVGQKWVDMVKLTQQHVKFELNYNMEQYMIQDEESGSSTSRRDWISFKRYGEWCLQNPQIISIDCEMCETTDPVSNSVEEMALSRISVIDVATDEVLLDTLVKPSWPVTDYRSNITGITAEHLQTVQFTLRHAQAFLLSLCSDQTIIIGHALHHDLATLKIKDHTCVVDSAILYQTVRNSERATVSLKDLASHVLKIEMPLVHDSVNDARVAMQCIVHYMNNMGKNLDTRIPRMFNGDNTASNVADEQQPSTGTLDFRSRRLLIHHVPKNSCNESDIIKMFTLFTDIKPKEVEEIDFPPLNTKTGYSYGKTTITFRSAAHANLAFDTLLNRVEYCPSNRKQKRINLKNGHYIWVRKMIWENEMAQLANIEAKEAEQQQNQ